MLLSLHCTLLTVRTPCFFPLVIISQSCWHNLGWCHVENLKGHYKTCIDKCSLLKWGVLLPVKCLFSEHQNQSKGLSLVIRSQESLWHNKGRCHLEDLKGYNKTYTDKSSLLKWGVLLPVKCHDFVITACHLFRLFSEHQNQSKGFALVIRSQESLWHNKGGCHFEDLKEHNKNMHW